MSWYIKVLKNYAVFSGRARRKEYWMFVLFNFIFYVALTIIDVITGMYSDIGLGVLSGIYSLALFIPALAVAVRRLHDTNRSGWWLFIALVPFVGAIILLVFLATDSQPGENQYGPNPKASVA
jgi:uncharacterized membrane protein YhaH (DUF805 family)